MPSTQIQKLADSIDKYYGKEMIRVIRSLLKHRVLDIESLAKKTGYSINTVRRALYTLHKKGIVQFYRKPEGDSEMVYWVLRETDYEKILKKLAEDLPENKKKKQKEGTLFVCPECGLEFTFDEAVEYEFRCPEDGTTLVAKL